MGHSRGRQRQLGRDRQSGACCVLCVCLVGVGIVGWGRIRIRSRSRSRSRNRKGDKPLVAAALAELITSRPPYCELLTAAAAHTHARTHRGSFGTDALADSLDSVEQSVSGTPRSYSPSSLPPTHFLQINVTEYGVLSFFGQARQARQARQALTGPGSAVDRTATPGPQHADWP